MRRLHKRTTPPPHHWCSHSLVRTWQHVLEMLSHLFSCVPEQPPHHSGSCQSSHQEATQTKRATHSAMQLHTDYSYMCAWANHKVAPFTRRTRSHKQTSDYSTVHFVHVLQLPTYLHNRISKPLLQVQYLFHLVAHTTNPEELAQRSSNELPTCTQVAKGIACQLAHDNVLFM